ncbi:MAG: hypothetical protein IJT25_00540, partial [Clostridia bacterium]|nr:hypothetical protein [Clostridia bacterium]
LFGAYPTSIVNGVARSVSGKAKYLTYNVQMAQQQSYANSRGTNFAMTNLNNSLLVQMLFVMQFKSLNYRESIGYGFAATSEKTKVYTGYSDEYPTKTYGYKTTTNKLIDRFLNIEGFISFANYSIDGSLVSPTKFGIMDVSRRTNNWVDNTGANYMFLKINWPTTSRRGKAFVVNNYFGIIPIDQEEGATTGGFDFFKSRTTNLSANSYVLHFPSAGNALVGVFSYVIMHVGMSNYGYGHRLVYYDL